MSEAEHCDHIVLMYAGRVVEDDTPEAMKQALQAEAGQLLEILTDKPLIALDQLEKSHFEGAALFGKRVHLFVQDTDQAMAQITDLLAKEGVQVIAINKRPATMEDVFVYRVLALESKGDAQ
jgi:ABC-2 type transport system ATP-binding protein